MDTVFALVLSLLTAEGNNIDVIKDVYTTLDECNQVIFDERLFNGSCHPIDKIIHHNESYLAAN